MRWLSLLFAALLYLQKLHAAPGIGEETIGQARLIGEWSPLRLFSNVFGWFSDSGVDGEPLPSLSQNTRTTFKILNPIKNVISKASRAATRSWSGVRHRIHNALNSVSDFLVHKIPYAEETTKLPGQRLPEYARGVPIPDYNDLGINRKWNDDWSVRHDQLINRVSSGNEDTTEQNKEEKRMEYDRYQSVHGTSFDQILDYEQLLENQIRSPVDIQKDEHPFTVFSILYDKLRHKLTNNGQKSDV